MELRCAPLVAMVKAADFGKLHHRSPIRRLHRAGLRRVLVQRQVRPRSGIVLHVAPHNSPQVHFAEYNDVIETTAIKRVFGEHARALAISSTKSATGHLLGAAGGLETGITALAIARNTIPATLNLDNPGEGCDLDYTPKVAGHREVRIAISNSFGFGGTNACVVLGKLR